jgi:hypothetical protein
MASTFRTGRNRHLTRDVGAFQVGLGVSLGAVLVGMKGIPAVLAGAASAAVLHVVSHVVDYGDGGRSSDPFVLGAVALVLVLAFVVEWRSADGRPSRPQSRSGVVQGVSNMWQTKTSSAST